MRESSHVLAFGKQQDISINEEQGKWFLQWKWKTTKATDVFVLKVQHVEFSGI